MTYLGKFNEQTYKLTHRR